jgi:transcriptional regulator with XRE-family HTH domain
MKGFFTMIDDLSPINIGIRIRDKLEKFQMKQKDLVELTNLSKNAISNYISGKRIPDTNSIYKISKALNTPIEWFLTGNNLKNITDAEKELLDLYYKLPEKEQYKLLGRLEHLVEQYKNK